MSSISLTDVSTTPANKGRKSGMTTRSSDRLARTKTPAQEPHQASPTISQSLSEIFSSGKADSPESQAKRQLEYEDYYEGEPADDAG